MTIIIKSLFRRRLRQFSRRYDYNTEYLDYVLQHNTGAFLKFSSIKLVSGHHRGIPLTPWFAASIRAALWEDCGPCAQLISLGFTISASRVYPTLKYVLGFGRACSRVQIEERSVIPQKLLIGEAAL